MPTPRKDPTQMSLPSQTARAGSQIGRTNMYRAKRSDPKPMIAAAGAVVVFGLGVWGLAKYLSPRHADGAEFGAGGGAPAVQKDGGGAVGAGEKSAASGSGAMSALVSAAPPLPAAAVQPEKLLASDAPVMPEAKDLEPVELRQGRTGSGMGAVIQQVGQVGHTRGAGSPQTAAPGVTAGGASPGASTPSSGSPQVTQPPAAVVPIPPASGSGVTPVSGGSARPVTVSATGAVATTIAAANQKLGAGDLVAARLLYSEALRDQGLGEADRGAVRETLTGINDDLVFSPKVTPGDPFVDSYTVLSGDRIIKIAQKLQLAPDYRLIKRINHIQNDRDLKVGQKLKIVKGPFNAIVNKSAFRLDLYMGDGENQDTWVYVRSFPVGLGAESKNKPTPIGTFRSKKGSKLVDPPWINPDTGQKFAGGAPDNPIGKFWVGLEGVGDAAKYTGYGIHGTIEPDSIGQQRSAGCVRMGAEDIALVFETMGEQVSVVKIVP